MDYKLELVLIPVTDVDRAKKFYLDNMGSGITSAAPGSAQGLHLVAQPGLRHGT
jgi:hypothetical protein